MARFLARELTRPSSAPPPPALQDALLVVRAALATTAARPERLEDLEDANYTGQELGTIARIAAALGHPVEVNLVRLKA